MPYETNEIADKWEKKTVEVVGFASSSDFSDSYSKGDQMKVASMEVFSQAACNDKLDYLLEENRQCKFNSNVIQGFSQ